MHPHMFVNTLKVGYLYYVVDRNGTSLVHLKNIENGFFIGKSIESVVDHPNQWHIDQSRIANVPYGEIGFNSNRTWAFYEIGPKEYFPDLFI